MADRTLELALADAKLLTNFLGIALISKWQRVIWRPAQHFQKHLSIFANCLVGTRL